MSEDPMFRKCMSLFLALLMIVSASSCTMPDQDVPETGSPGELDLLSKCNDAVVLSIDPTELIWCYGFKTGGGNMRYHAVLNLDRPFPFTVEVK